MFHVQICDKELVSIQGPFPFSNKLNAYYFLSFSIKIFGVIHGWCASLYNPCTHAEYDEKCRHRNITDLMCGRLIQLCASVMSLLCCFSINQRWGYTVRASLVREGAD